MSMQIFEESGVFDPSFWNLKVGDILQVISVGGGGGGGAASINMNASERIITGSGGNAGECGFANTTNASNSTCGGGGGGYGGGGGGGGGGAYPGAGGGGGYLKTATIKLTSLDPIAVTIGKGGRGGYDDAHLDGEDGEASSFGSYVVAEGGGGGKAKTKSEYSLPGIGGTRGGFAKDHQQGAGGGGGGYLIGCNIRGNGGPGFMGATSFGSGTYPAKQMTFGNAVGLGGAGGAQTWNYTPKPGSLGGGIWNEVAGPGSGVVVVTW